MQKFTVFSIILSMTLLLVLGDLVVHDYLKAGAETIPVLEKAADTGSTSVLNTLIPDETVEEVVELPVIEVEASLQADTFASAGFSSPILKEAIYSGLIFQFIPFSEADNATVQQSHLFNGEEFVGTVYEVAYPTETASFQGYLTLRERSKSLAHLGSIYEANTSGDSSFYFNHDAKTKTVHLIMRSGNTVYAFEYAHLHHESMKNVFDLI